ncbi:DUF4384 domain-containing protein [Deinococcus pimensis]|uniref:DUF4384 domain-containing protein n=1 Tax=Deinococcus pimensis TaxID=309888 RepID=UPI000482CBB8|nr:DUF4384 domain-containing protein [Deinococcus pimensis]
MKKSLLLAALSLGLGACTVSVRPGVSVNVSQANLVTNFQPDRGEGSTYFVGERIRFNLSTARDGYVTVVSLDPDGRGDVLLNNAFVRAGTSTIGADNRFQITPPRGVQRVRVIFTTERPSSTLVFRGQYSRGEWNTYTESYVRPYGVEQRDVYETFFYIR